MNPTQNSNDEKKLNWNFSTVCCPATHAIIITEFFLLYVYCSTLTTNFGNFSCENDLLFFPAIGGSLPIWNTSTIDAPVMANTKRNVVFEGPFDLAAMAHLIFSTASHNHNPDLVQIQTRTFLTCAKEGAWGFKNKKKNSSFHLPSTKNSIDSHVLLIFSIIFQQIPNESSSHLLAPVRQLSKGKQRSIQDCTVATSTQEPETTLQRNEALPRQPLFHFGRTPVRPCVFVEGKTTSVQWEEVAVSQPSLSVSVGKAGGVWHLPLSVSSQLSRGTSTDPHVCRLSDNSNKRCARESIRKPRLCKAWPVF